jgi:hypothetical protein
MEPGRVMLAGDSSAWSGTVVPSGSVVVDPSSPALDVAAMLVVQAPDNSASGTRAVAFCHVVSRL